MNSFMWVKANHKVESLAPKVKGMLYEGIAGSLRCLCEKKNDLGSLRDLSAQRLLFFQFKIEIGDWSKQKFKLALSQPMFSVQRFVAMRFPKFRGSCIEGGRESQGRTVPEEAIEWGVGVAEKK